MSIFYEIEFAKYILPYPSLTAPIASCAEKASADGTCHIAAEKASDNATAVLIPAKRMTNPSFPFELPDFSNPFYR